MPASERSIRDAVLSHLQSGGRLTFFLDYDGTLIPIAPTPAEALADAALLQLLAQLAGTVVIRTVILSGRPLADLRKMLPVRGLILAGLYGVEMQMGDIALVRAPAGAQSREIVSQVRGIWARLTDGLPGFMLEDKGLALALHARWAARDDAERIVDAARDAALEVIRSRPFRLLGGDRYIEIAPAMADKGETVDWLLSEYPVRLDLPVVFGDDNKDDAAFAAVKRRGGYAIGVGHRYPLPGIDARVETPEMARDWLRNFVDDG